MQSISGAIIVLSGAILLAAGSHVTHGDTQGFVMMCGAILCLAGLVGWFRTLQSPPSNS